MSVTLVIVSHSVKLAEGVKELVSQMNPGLLVSTAGGTDECALGTSATRVHAALEKATANGGEALILMDLGSAYLSSTLAIELLDEAIRSRVALAEAPLVEGAFLAAFEAATSSDLQTVKAAAEEGKEMKKIN